MADEAFEEEGGGGGSAGLNWGSLVEEMLDTSGRIPTVRLRVLWGTVVGSVLWGIWVGVIDVVQTVLSIPRRMMTGLTNWIGDYYTALFDIPVHAIEVAWEANAEFLAGTLGPWGYFAAILQIGIFAYLLVRVLEISIRVLWWGFQ